MKMQTRTYETAVTLLNSLQSSSARLQQWQLRSPPSQKSVAQQQETRDRVAALLTHIGCDISVLKFLHIAGTKGKGTTCMYLESLLRNHALACPRTFKIGLYTSPHLKEVRERIKLNGRSISKELFTRYFFDLWSRLESENRLASLTYFPMLTLLSFHIFKQEKVDIAIYETGIGGEYDCTNVIQRPVAAGITHLGIDHVSKLGSTIEQIAWHKAGIYKTGCPALSSPQDPRALKILQQRSIEKTCTLEIVPVDTRLKSAKLQPQRPYQYENASLALRLFDHAMNALGCGCHVDQNNVRDILEHTTFPGRAHILPRGHITWYIDVAHTTESVAEATYWFVTVSGDQNVRKAIVFNHQSNRRDGKQLLDAISAACGKHYFRDAIFCPDIICQGQQTPPDLENRNVDPDVVKSMAKQQELAQHWSTFSDPSCNVMVEPDIRSAIRAVRFHVSPIHVLVVGDAHLAGGFLAALE